MRLAESCSGIHAVKRFPRMVLQKKMVAKFDEQGAHTVPFQQCIDSEVQILRRWVELFRSSPVGRLQDLAPACGAVAGGRGMTF